MWATFVLTCLTKLNERKKCCFPHFPKSRIHIVRPLNAVRLNSELSTKAAKMKTTFTYHNQLNLSQALISCLSLDEKMAVFMTKSDEFASPFLISPMQAKSESSPSFQKEHFFLGASGLELVTSPRTFANSSPRSNRRGQRA